MDGVAAKIGILHEGVWYPFLFLVCLMYQLYQLYQLLLLHQV